MQSRGSSATCVPVRLGGAPLEAALFVEVSGEECEQDRISLERADAPTGATLDIELIGHASAAIVALKLEVLTIPDDPLRYEVLLTPGAVESHYRALELLAGQRRLCWFFGDADGRIIQAQEQDIGDAQRADFESVRRDAFAHDALIRVTRRYDVAAALSEVVSHYTMRRPHDRPAG